MEFNERKHAPKWLDLPGWNYEIDYDGLRKTFPNPLFVLAFGSAIRPPAKETVRYRSWWRDRTKEVRRYAKDVDLLIVTDEKITPYKVHNGLPCRYGESDGYGFWWVTTEIKGALHLQVATRKQLQKAIEQKDEDARRILSSCEIIEGDVTLAKGLMALATL